MLGNSLNLYGTISLPVKWKWWLSHRVVRIALKEIIYAEHAVYSRHIIATSLVVKWKLLSRVWFCASPWTIVHGILQARILEWVAVPFSRGSSQTKGSNPGLPHCRWILYQLSHQGSPTSLIQSVQSLSRVQLFATPWAAAHQASLSITNYRSLLKLMSIESVMPSNHLILCHPLLPPSIFPSIRVFSNGSVLRIRWPEYWSFSFSISPSNEYSGLVSFRID